MSLPSLRMELQTPERSADRGHPVNKHVRLRLRRIRKMRGIPCDEMARRTCMPASSYSCLENGHFRIGIDALLRILMALEADVTEVFPRSESELLAPLPAVQAVTCQDIARAAAHAAKSDRLGIAAELAAGQRHITMKGLARQIGCHPSSLSHARRRLQQRLPSSPELRQQLEEARQRLGAAP